MNAESIYLVNLLRDTIHGHPVSPPKQSVDWESLLAMSITHRVAATIYSSIAALSPEDKPDSAILERWQRYAMQTAMQQIALVAGLTEVLSMAEAAGITPIIVKGPVLNALYPEPLARETGDVDILVSPKDEQDFFHIMHELGCLEEGVPDQPWHEYSYTMPNGLSYDVHRQLWEGKAGSPRQIAFAQIGLDEPQALMKTQVPGLAFYTLNCYHQFIYMLYHMSKHFVVDGMGLRHLADVTLFYNSNKEDIDGSRFWADADLLGYDTFCKTTFYICIKHFGMDASIFPEWNDYSGDMEEEVMDDILTGGLFGRGTIARDLSRRIMRQYYDYDSDKLPTHKWGLYFSLAFPPKTGLERIDFLALSDNKFLAWFQRLFYLMKRWRIRRTEGLPVCSLKERMDCTMARVHMLKKLKLL